jgi:hypothetical protein
MNVVCLEEPAFYALIDRVMERIKEKHGIRENKWIPEMEAMQMLGISSKTTLQKYRDEKRIRFSQPDIKPIMYDRNSINDYLEKHANTTD